MNPAANSPWVGIEQSVILAVHDEQLVEHGGAAGVRDLALLESALARPQQLASSGDPDVAALAASYGFGPAKNHAFVDGNKRAAFVATELFLLLNGTALVANDVECTLTMLAVAAGDLDEAAFTEWLRLNVAKR